MNNLIIPTSPADRKKIRDAMTEISNAFARIEGERSYVKEAVDVYPVGITRCILLPSINSP